MAQLSKILVNDKPHSPAEAHPASVLPASQLRSFAVGAAEAGAPPSRGQHWRVLLREAPIDLLRTPE
eukprot:gene17043-654_t